MNAADRQKWIDNLKVECEKLADQLWEMEQKEERSKGYWQTFKLFAKRLKLYEEAVHRHQELLAKDSPKDQGK